MEQQESEKPPFCWLAIVSVIFGIGCLTIVGLIALPLGLISFFRTRGNKRRGHKASKYGLGLGIISLVANITGCPGMLYSPPIMPEDRAFVKFLDDLGNGRHQQCRGYIRFWNSSELTDAEFARWAEAFNKKNGKGQLIWPGLKMTFADPMRSYIVRFEKTGVQKMIMYGGNDPEGWELVTPYDFPRIDDPRFSDQYHNDPEFRKEVDQE